MSIREGYPDRRAPPLWERLEAVDSGRRFPSPEALVSSLGARTAHDLNNLIAVLSGHLYLIRQSSAPDAEGLDAMQTAIAQLERLSRNLAALGTTGSSGRRPLSANEVARRVAARHSSGALRLDLDESLPTVEGNEADLVEALHALVLNAVEASSPDAPIRLSTRHEPPAVVLEVEDAGRGIAPAIAERIFDPFFSTKGGRGRGMGLFLAATVAAAHGTSCRVEPREEGGIRASLPLPVSGER